MHRVMHAQRIMMLERGMRTTVNLDPELLAEAKAVAASTGRTLGDVLDDALRIGLARGRQGAEQKATFCLPVLGEGGLRPGVDLDDREALADLLGDQDPRVAL